MQSLSQQEGFAVVMGRLLTDHHTSIRRLAHLSGVSRRTLENWVHGQVAKPRHWEPILQIAKALHVTAAETDALLLSAGQPNLATLLKNGSPEALEMAHAWQATSILSRERLKTTNVTPHNLPSAVSSFIGRQDEIAAVQELLGNTRLVTLAGTGGIGKTRLAIEVAWSLVPHFPQGIYLIELSGTEQGEHVPLIVAEKLGIAPPTNSDIVTGLVRALQPRRLLLILDNCEHLLEACAELTNHLLHYCPQLTILTTSRATLGLEGEHVYQVPVLTVPKPDAAPETLNESPAETLFVERARSVDSSFQATSLNGEAISEVVRRLDGIPLAIELAAARTSIFTPQEIAQRLDDRFRLLTKGQRFAPPRHQTLEATIDWSYDLLAAEEQTLLAQLGVFADGWTLESAEAVAGQVSNANSMQALVDQSLVIAHTAGEQRRFSYLETIRHYALHRLSKTDGPDPYMARLLHFYSERAERDELAYRGPRQLEIVSYYDREISNLRAVITWGLRHDPVATTRLVVALRPFWDMRGRIREASDTLDKLMSLLESGELQLDETLLGRLLLTRSAILSEEGRLDLSVRDGVQALEIFRRFGDEANIALQLHFLAVTTELAGHFELSQAWLEQGITVGMRIEDDYAMALLYFTSSLLRLREGKHDLALTLVREVNELHLDAGRDFERIPYFSWMVKVALESEPIDFSGARRANEQMRALAERFGDRLGLATVFHWNGRISLAEGDLVQAEHSYLQALEMYDQMGSHLHSPWSLIGLAEVSRQQGDITKARDFYAEAQMHSTLNGNHIDLARIEERLADLEAEVGGQNFVPTSPAPTAAPPTSSD